MTQKISAEITIPSDLILISKIEYEELQEGADVGRWWTLKDVLSRINRERDWFKQNVLFNPKYKKRIDVKNGGFVKYPTGGRDTYLFLPSRTKEFLEENFAELLK